MSFTESLSEIINTARKLESVDEKVAYLRSKKSTPLIDVLVLMCDSRFTFDLPPTDPPYRPSVHTETHGLLYRETRKFKYFIKEHTACRKIDQLRKESLYIQMLENVDPGDAKLLLRIVSKQPYPDLSPEVIDKAFPGHITNPVEVKRGRGRPKKSESTQ